MSGREWVPGDPIPEREGGHVVTLRWNEVALTTLLAKVKESYPPGYVSLCDAVYRSLSARALVVIDPEDRGQAVRLTDAFFWAEDDRRADTHGYGRMQAALRSLIEPPTPPEPTKKYAVVVDAVGDEWIRTAESPPSPWLRSGYFTAEQWTDYADINAVRVLSEGVSDV